MSTKGPTLPGQGETDYERYIRTGELLALQKSRETLVNPEELLFQVTHQAAELWLKEIDWEIDRAVEMLEGDRLLRAARQMDRCVLILDLLREQIVILETMDPADYHVIRVNSLGRGSGQESPGFNRLLDAGDRIWPPFSAILSRLELTPLDVLREPERHYNVNSVLQSMLGYDAAFMKWRYTHMRLAIRVIGSRVKSLKGVPVTQLDQGTREPMFPALWEAVSDLTDEIRPA